MSDYLDKQAEMELVEKAKQDYQAFDKLYEYYMPRIYGYLFSRAQNKEDAQDLTSQTFEKAVAGLHDFEVQENIRFSSWLYRIAINNLTDYYRKNAGRKTVGLDDLSQPLKDEKAEITDETQQRNDIVNYLAELSAEDQQILTLKFFQDLPNDEIAEIMGIKYNHLGVKIYRALKKLKDVIKNNE